MSDSVVVDPASGSTKRGRSGRSTPGVRNTTTPTPAEALVVLRHLGVIKGCGTLDTGVADEVRYLAQLVSDTTPQGVRTLARVKRAASSAEQRVINVLEAAVTDPEGTKTVLQDVVNRWVAASFFSRLD